MRIVYHVNNFKKSSFYIHKDVFTHLYLNIIKFGWLHAHENVLASKIKTFVCLFFIFGGSGDWTQDLTHGRQMLYPQPPNKIALNLSLFREDQCISLEFHTYYSDFIF